ncbi:phage tail protein [Avibacterium avium]|uniref:phage tail protein n=1 Tax=Avibacterium avium TaxID=751 RepID=UPI003BF79910
MKLLDLFKTIIWAKNGDTTDFSQTNYEAGWAHLGDDTPTVQDFNYVQQMNDKKDQWLFKQLKAVMENAGIEPTEDNINALLNAIFKIAKGHSTPKAINAETVDFVDETGHTHSISKASLTQLGIVQLTNALDSDSETLGLTAKAGKTLKALIDALTRNLGNYIPNSKKSSATDSESEDNVATSKAVKKAYDRAVEAEGKGLPVGAVLAFPSAVQNPQGFLKCDGSTFGRSTYPDLYRALGNSDKLPDLRRSDIGMTAYFATDNIPDGWVAFDDIRTQVTQERYPELYRYLTAKYGSIAAVPLAEDRFVRNAGAGLNVGQTQADEFKRHAHASIHGEDQYATSPYLKGLWTKGDKYPYQVADAQVDGATGNQSFIIPNDTAENAPLFAGGDETRPKSLVLKLCIKAQNTFDDVRFWIKAFGAVANAGQLDASKLAQDLQRVQAEKAPLNHTHRVNQIPDFNTGVDNRIAQLFTYQKIGNFEVRKYPDGTMIQTYVIKQNDLYEWFEKSFNWAIAFVDTPLIFSKVTTSIRGSHNGGVNILTKSNNATCYYHEYENGSSNQGDVRIQFLAIGRWK